MNNNVSNNNSFLSEAYQMALGIAAKQLPPDERKVIRLVSKKVQTSIDQHAKLTVLEKIDSLNKRIARLEDNLIMEALESTGKVSNNFRYRSNLRQDNLQRKIDALRQQIQSLSNKGTPPRS